MMIRKSSSEYKPFCRDTPQFGAALENKTDEKKSEDTIMNGL